MKKNNDNKTVWIIGIIIIILVLLIFIPGLIEDKRELETLKHEEQLMQQGKIKNDSDIMNEISIILKERDNTKLQQYISNDFVYYDNENIEHKYLSKLWDDLQYLVDNNYDVEKRENSLEDKETYRIYWNIAEENKNKGIDKTSQYYCLQKITIILERVVKENIITYEIEKIILTNN